MKEMEYPDSPSGSVMLYNYKEPFMRFESGFGYEGVLLFDAENDTTQCHFCGEWLEHLPSHLHKEHAMSASQYKEAVGLSKGTALISESFRAKLIKAGIENRLKNLKSRKGRKHSEKAKNLIREARKENRREIQNITGTCPAQLIERIQKECEKYGRTPTTREADSLRKTVVRVFGSWKRGLELAGITPRENTEKTPEKQDYHPYVYSEQELKDFLTQFKDINGRNPSTSDCRRGLIPSQSTYRGRFGKFSNALKEANLV